MVSMRSLLLLAAALAVVGCADVPPGTLKLLPDNHTVQVGQSTFVTAYLDDGMTPNPEDHAVDVSWQVDMSSVIMLTPVQNIQKVTGLMVGNAVVTASGFDQSVQTGFTVVSP